MSYTIVADVCEGIHDCVPCCPAECIHHGEGTNAKGTEFTIIDPKACTNCGVCLSICPIEGAILDEWRPTLQEPAARSAEHPATPPAATVFATAQSAATAGAAATLAQAKKLEEDGDTAGAIDAYERVLGLADPQSSAEAAFRLGSLLEERDRGAAVAAYRRGLEFTDSPYMPRCALDAGALLHRDGSHAAAAELYRQAMDSPLGGDFAAIAACNLGMALASQGDVSGAVWAYRGAIGCAHPRQSPKAAHHLGKLLDERGDTSGAVTAYEQVFRFDDDDLSAEAAFDLGYLLSHHGETRAAIEAYRRGFEFSESEYMPMCAFNAGLLLMNQGDASGAAEMYRRALMSPHTTHAALAARNLGDVLAGQGDTDGAAAAYRQVLEHDDGDLASAARSRLGQLQGAHGQDPHSTVREAIRRWAAGNLADAGEKVLTGLVDAIESLQSESCDVRIKVGAREMKNGRAVYGFSWFDEFHTFDLSAEQASQLGIEPDTFTLRGVGGKPRGDTREFPPAMHIATLQINDGRPVRPDVPFTVTVSCDPGARVSQNLALRVSYPLDGMTLGFSHVKDAIPPDGLLRKEIGPLTEDGWDGGPVPIFVDVVAIHQDDDDLRFSIFSNTLAALVDVVEPASAPQDRDQREAALRWAGSVFTGGPGSPLVDSLAKGIDGIVADGNHFAVLMPADFTTDKTAYYAFSCAGGFFPLPMTPQQAAACGVESDGLVLRGTFNVDAHVLPHIAELRDLQLTADGAPAADAEVDGTVVGAFHKPLPEKLMLRISRIFGDGSQVLLQPVRELPAGGVLAFTLPPNSEEKSRGRGPVPVAVDLCVTQGSGPSMKLSSVSNSVVSLFDVTRSAPTQTRLAPPTPGQTRVGPPRSTATRPAASDPETPPLVLDAPQKATVRRAFERAGIAFPGQSAHADTEFRGTLPRGYRDCFLADGDVAGMTLAEDNRVLRTFPEDGDAFPAAGGLVCGLTRWEQKGGRSLLGRRTSGRFPSDRLIDLRWMFSDADSALRWHRDRLEQNSEGMPPLGSHTSAGVEYHCFGGRQADPAGGSFVQFSVLFVVGPVIAKLYAADIFEKFGLTAEHAQELAHKAGQRIATTLSSR